MKKSYRRKWRHSGCIIRQRGDRFQVEVNRSGKRKRSTWPTLAEAKTFAEQESSRVKNEGTAALALSLDQRADAAKAIKALPAGMHLLSAAEDYAKEIARLGGVPLKNAVDFYLLHHKPAGGVRTVAELFAGYLTEKAKENCRSRSLADMKCRIGRLAKDFGQRQVHTITAAEIEAWLDKYKYTGQSRINYLRVFTSFFNYARMQRLIEFNPADQSAIKRPKMDEHLPEIFSVQQAERLLQTAVEKADVIVPYLALGFFAGVRSAELQGLTWADVDFAAKLITVRPEVAKKRRQRHVVMSENLVAWLAPYAKKTGGICPPPSVVRSGVAAILKDTGIQWIHNGMRHTFASCHLAKHQDISKTALELGHTGNPTVLFNHYRNLVKPVEAEAYWNILPKREAQIIKMPAIAG